MRDSKTPFDTTSPGDLRLAPRSLRIIVADDDNDTVLSLMLLLREEGHDVQGVRESRDVLKGVNRFRPDAVLLDIAMPELSGWEVARQIRQRLGRRPLLIGISGAYTHAVDEILSNVIGFDYYLVKPYAPEALLKLLERLRLTPNAG